MAIESVYIDGYRIDKGKMLGTGKELNWYTFTVYEYPRNDDIFQTEFSTMYWENEGKRWGKTSTRKIHEWLDDLPAMTQERIDKVQAYFKAIYEFCYDLIFQAFPELKDIENLHLDMGDIDLFEYK